MKVKELVERLQKLDQNLEVFCYTDDSAEKHGSQWPGPFDVNAVDATHAELNRSPEGRPLIRFGSAETAKRMYAILTITGEW